MPPVLPDSASVVSDGRPSWDEYFMAITELVASRATCLRRKVGAVLVKDKRILCSGYNGAPSQIPHCRETGCLREQLNVPSGEKHELCRGVHAEQNVIIQAAFHGIPVAGASLYCTTQPCSICAKMIINAGIKKVYFKKGYDDPLSLEMFAQAGVELIRLE
ncbi:deoxycytidylate deaminase [Desulfobacter postgatei]|uniref:Deoxycytidylate deaminase n=1 Tax=Desulfobacter postgatei 2ac9 TaxID=879212 RepID=I5B5D0_9BACT|nr:cytidine/deoxycytidylate deaminase family protein [Desulfobacter postgatei]EIM64693.1 deoxycytidylate deaminase [Desulfobacter postgatei 2ac9]